jgi:AcrR family transcriptional regulator
MSTLDQASSQVSFAEQTRERLRAAILDATAAEVLARGWRGLRMQAVADRVGVIRQAINTEFGDKTGLARALVLRFATGYCQKVTRTVEASPDIWTAIHDSVAMGLTATRDEVFRVVMTPDSSETFLPLYTTESAPIVEVFTAGVTEAYARRWPELGRERVRVAANAMTRFVLSNIVLPLAPIEQTAREAANLFTPYFTTTSGQPHAPTPD